MTVYAPFRVGRLTLTEGFTIAETGGDVRTFDLEGSSTITRESRAVVEQKREDVINSPGEMVPIIFTEKKNFDGIYVINSSSAQLTNWDNFIVVMTWKMNVTRVGSLTGVDFESRLSGSITRSNAFTAVGKRWHAPPVGPKAYWVGNSAPISVDRIGEEGTLKVFQNLPQGINPRWGVPIENYEKGRVRFLDQNGLERVGTQLDTSATNWELSNSLIRIRPVASGGTLEISTFVSGTWRPKIWDILYSTGPAVSVGLAEYVTVLHNNYHSCTIRLTEGVGTVGRVSIDITLRRGASFAEIYAQHEFGTTLRIARGTVEAGTSVAGYVVATAADADGLKYIVGSALAFTADAANGAISKATTATLDAIVGVQLNTTAGNAAADLYQQYLGSPSEIVRGVSR